MSRIGGRDEWSPGVGNRLPVSVLSLALMIALAGCGLTGIDRPIGGEARGGGAGAAAGPPPGGWPQPENGRLTDKMCGLLTDADYAKFGHRRLPRVSEKRQVQPMRSAAYT
jgi:hypothetical protein